MKIKAMMTAICGVVCAGALFTAVQNVETASAENPVDISSGVTISGWQDSAELKLLTISFDRNVLSNFDYDAMDTEEFAYIQEYLSFNGKTVKEINEDTSLGAVNWTYTQFPGNADDKYKVPVLIYERDAARLRLYIHENYFNMLGGAPTFEINEGLEFTNEGSTYVMGETRSFTLVDNQWTASQEKTDVTSNVVIDGWGTTGDASELSYTRISFGNGVLPENIDYHILDSDIGTQYHYIKDYITINGKTVGQINAETDVSKYVFSSFPSTAADKYKLPVILFENGGVLEVKVHNSYLASLGADPKVTVGVKAGLTISNGGALYEVAQDVAVVVKEGTEASSVDITENITIEGWDTTGDASELKYTRISFGENVLPAGIDYGIMDGNYQYLQDYITINGKTVKEINTTTDVSSYVFSTFPSTADVKYQVPVVIFVNGTTLEVKVHNDYVATLGTDADITICVTEGAYVAADATVYVVSQDVEVMVKGEVEITTVDVTENVFIGGWKIVGDLSELTRTIVSFGEGVLPEGLDYGVMDKDHKYLQEYITINGKTVKEINETTDVSSYVFHTFPSTADVKYQVPVIIFAKGDNLEINIHNDYLAALGGNLDVVVGVKAGLSITNGNNIYNVTKDVQEYARRKQYTLTVELGLGLDEQYLTVGSDIIVTAPQREGYTFVGWFEKETDNAALTVMPERDYAIYAKYTAIPYTVTFMDGETVIGTATYTLDDTSIELPTLPTKEGYTSAWESFTLTGGDVTVNVVYTLIETPVDPENPDGPVDPENPEDSSSEDSSVEDSSSEDSSVEDSSVEDSTSSSIEEDSAEEDSSVADSTSSSSSASESGCSGVVGGMAIVAVGLMAAILLKKKENE